MIQTFLLLSDSCLCRLRSVFALSPRITVLEPSPLNRWKEAEVALLHWLYKQLKSTLRNLKLHSEPFNLAAKSQNSCPLSIVVLLLSKMSQQMF